MKTNENLGITLVSLVVTIIILLILAGITISQLTGSGLFENAKLAEEKAENAQKYENGVLSNYEQWMGNYLGDKKTNNGEIDTNPDSDEDTGNGLIIETETAHTVSPLTYTWEELKEIAKIISDNDDIITNDTLRVEMAIGKKIYVLGVGDTTKVNYAGTEMTVKILGFNHDKLANNLAYEGQESIYAGISFIFQDKMPNTIMNSTDTNLGGWKESKLRSELNDTFINNFDNKDCIKEVVKEYIQTYNDEESVNTCTDKLWLLSCSEIYSDGYETGKFGAAIAKEGNQYKYYKDLNTRYSKKNDALSFTTWGYWWLRSPRYDSSSEFCAVLWDGSFSRLNTSSTYAWPLPGFSI